MYIDTAGNLSQIKRERDIRNICAGWKSKPATVDRKDSFAVTRVSAAYNTTVKLSLKSVGVM